MTGIVQITCWLTLLLLSACASQIPVNVREAPVNNPTIEEVRENTQHPETHQVRWGGKILTIENRQNTTRLTILSKPLSRAGEPASADESDGRFIVIINTFIDPEVYKQGREITIRGTLTGAETHPVGDFPYTYPIVKASDWYLWPERMEYPADYYSPWWLDDPWYYDPWYPFPFYHPYYDRY